MFTRGVSLVDVRPRGAPNGEPNMARKTHNSVEHDQSAETEVEAEIREFVRRDVVTNRERQPENESEMMASSINAVMQRATTTSVQEIDKLITELQTLSDRLHSERCSARGSPIFNLDQSGLAVDQDHRRKPDAVQKGPRRAGPARFERPVSRIVRGKPWAKIPIEIAPPAHKPAGYCC